MEPLSINALADLFGVDRRTLARRLRLGCVSPAGQGPRGPLYRPCDAFRELTRPDHPAAHADGAAHAATTLVAYLDTDGRLDALAEQLGKVRGPAARARALRNALAEALWKFVAALDHAPPEAPDWPRLDPVTFASAWEAHLGATQLEDVAAIARGEDPW